MTGKVFEPPLAYSVIGAGTRRFEPARILEGRKLFLPTGGFEACIVGMHLGISGPPGVEVLTDFPLIREKRCIVEMLPSRRRPFLMSKNATAYVALAVLALGTLGSAAPEPSTAGRPATTYTGFTKPSEQRGLAFNGPGLVLKVNVKEGDFVKKGQLLAEQDARAERADLAVLDAKAAEADVEIRAAESTLAEKTVEWQKKQILKKQNVATDLEVLQAKLEVDIETYKLDYSKQEKAEKFLEVDAQKAKLGLKELRATTDGIVQQINVHEGELSANDPKNPVMTVVTNEPLFVEVDLPAPVAKHLQLHEKLQVRYADEGENDWQPAEIIFFNPVANYTIAESSQHVRLQLENPNHLRSGMNMKIKLNE